MMKLCANQINRSILFINGAYTYIGLHRCVCSTSIDIPVMDFIVKNDITYVMYINSNHGVYIDKGCKMKDGGRFKIFTHLIHIISGKDQGQTQLSGFISQILGTSGKSTFIMLIIQGCS